MDNVNPQPQKVLSDYRSTSIKQIPTTQCQMAIQSYKRIQVGSTKPHPTSLQSCAHNTYTWSKRVTQTHFDNTKQQKNSTPTTLQGRPRAHSARLPGSNPARPRESQWQQLTSTPWNGHPSPSCPGTCRRMNIKSLCARVGPTDVATTGGRRRTSTKTKAWMIGCLLNVRVKPDSPKLGGIPWICLVGSLVIIVEACWVCWVDVYHFVPRAYCYTFLGIQYI